MKLGVGLSSNNPSHKYGTIKRSTSNKRTDNGPNDRPSTAPQKNDKNQEKTLTHHNSMKRLPSPNVKCKNFLYFYLFLANNSFGNSSKNMSTTGINYAKYRSPSPQTGTKNSTIVMGSIKPTGMKKKWK